MEWQCWVVHAVNHCLYIEAMIDRMGISLLEGIFGRVEGILGSWQVCPDWGVMGKGTCSQHVCGVEL